MAVPLTGAIIGLHERDMDEGYRQQRIYLWGLLPNTHYMIIKEINCKTLNMYSLYDILVEYKRKWTQHLLRMKNTRIPKLVYEYTAAGRKNTGRPKDGGTNNPEALLNYTLWLMMIMMMTTTTMTMMTMTMMMMTTTTTTVQVYANL
jgi:hypothetical protein